MTAEYPATDRIELGFHAQNAQEAIDQAKAWAKAEGIVLRTVASARPVADSHDSWRVTLVVRTATASVQR